MLEEKIAKECIKNASDVWDGKLELQEEILESCGIMQFLEIVLTTFPDDWRYLEFDEKDVILTERGVLYNKKNVDFLELERRV